MRNNKQQEREAASLVDFVRNVVFDLGLKAQEIYNRQTARGYHLRQAGSPGKTHRWECEQSMGNWEL